MLERFAKAIASASERTPMLQQHAPPIPGRVLLIDGDAMCYTCAGNDDCDPGQARINMMDRIDRATKAARAERTMILVTGRGSHKGHRYAVARVKDYQGQRSSSRRPKNWEYLRQIVEGGGVPGTDITAIAEADDLFKKYSHQFGPENTVHHYQDKDMRQVPGWHLTWDDFGLVFVSPDAWSIRFQDKVYGRKWFWLQMLHGDTADNIPGLPEYADGSTYKDKARAGQLKFMKCGEVAAEKILADVTNEADARAAVMNAYSTYYPGDAEVQMLEQGILLWMRKQPGDVFDVCAEGHPLCGLDSGRHVIMQRIAEAQACVEA